MSIQKLLSSVRRAVTDYKMINDGDKIAVGLSGGKDSLLLATLLKAYQRFSPERFELGAITIDLGFDDVDFQPMVEYCKKLEIPYHIEPTKIADIIFNDRKEKNPCSLCSKMRRGALNTKLIELGYNKLALGHHADDLIETFFLSMFYEGRLSTFAPVSFMDRTGVTMIRPLIYTEEKDISGEAKNYPVTHNPCPANKHTQRQYVKDLLDSISKDIPFAKKRIHSAIVSPDRYNLFDKYNKGQNDTE